MKIFTDSRCQEHVSPQGYPERRARLEGILVKLGSSDWEIQEESPQPSAAEAVSRLHDERYLERFRRAVERGDGILDSADNPLSQGTWSGAWGAAEAAVAAAEWVQEASGRKAFVAVRPPGHHAERSTAMGFCFLNNAAVAAEHLRARHGLSRVAIFDFDIHHGNGTQHLFEERSDVLYASTHQFPFYPGTGARQEVGRGGTGGLDGQRTSSRRHRGRTIPGCGGGGDPAGPGAVPSGAAHRIRRLPRLEGRSPGGIPPGARDLPLAGSSAGGFRGAPLRRTPPLRSRRGL